MFKNGCRRCCHVMVDYLDAIGAGLILLDPTPLGFDYLPTELVARDELQRALAGRFPALATPAALDVRSSPGRSGAGRPASSGVSVTTSPVTSSARVTSPWPTSTAETKTRPCR